MVSAALVSALLLSAAGCSWFKSEQPPEGFPLPQKQTLPAQPAPFLVHDEEAAGLFEGLLKAASGKVRSAKDFHCLLARVEVVEGELRPLEELDFSQRFEPHALKLEWVGKRFKGRQVIYVTGANDNKVLVRAGGWSGTLTGWIKKTLRFELTSVMIKSQSRYTPDVAGYDRLVERLSEVYAEAGKAGRAWVKSSDPSENDGQRTRRFEVTLDPPLPDVDISKMIVTFDLDTSLPVRTILHDGGGRMVEDYDWRNIKLDVGLIDADFTFGKE